MRSGALCSCPNPNNQPNSEHALVGSWRVVQTLSRAILPKAASAIEHRDNMPTAANQGGVVIHRDYSAFLSSRKGQDVEQDRLSRRYLWEECKPESRRHGNEPHADEHKPVLHAHFIDDHSKPCILTWPKWSRTSVARRTGVAFPVETFPNNGNPPSEVGLHRVLDSSDVTVEGYDFHGLWNQVGRPKIRAQSLIHHRRYLLRWREAIEMYGPVRIEASAVHRVQWAMIFIVGEIQCAEESTNPRLPKRNFQLLFDLTRTLVAALSSLPDSKGVRYNREDAPVGRSLPDFISSHEILRRLDKFALTESCAYWAGETPAGPQAAALRETPTKPAISIFGSGVLFQASDGVLSGRDGFDEGFHSSPPRVASALLFLLFAMQCCRSYSMTS